MYTIERLQNLAEYLDVDSVDRILAEYFTKKMTAFHSFDDVITLV